MASWAPWVPAPGLLLGTVALALVAVVIAGPLALLLLPLLLLAWWRPGLLAPVALAAMAAAGVLAALDAGEAPGADQGAFSPAAQVLALTALFAALVGANRSRESAYGGTGAGPEAGSGARTGPGGDPAGEEEPEAARTRPLPTTPPLPRRGSRRRAHPGRTGGKAPRPAPDAQTSGPTLSARGPSPAPASSGEEPGPNSRPDADGKGNGKGKGSSNGSGGEGR